MEAQGISAGYGFLDKVVIGSADDVLAAAADAKKAPLSRAPSIHWMPRSLHSKTRRWIFLPSAHHRCGEKFLPTSALQVFRIRKTSSQR